ncbi:MAG: glycosyltransferase family 4 protein [Bacteroidaceae bacterium]|nr:glycosyltransferase family 4 protein [Bacteroidaceae bacterium]
MEKKKVLLDLTDLGNPTSGFGQIEKSFAEYYSKLEDDALSFHFLLPQNYESSFGEQVETTCAPGKLRKLFSKGFPETDLWHSVTQQQLCHKRGKPDKFLLTIHDLNYLREKGFFSRLKHHFILQRAINQADAVTCISKFVAKEVEEHFDLKGKPLRVIYNGVENITDKPESKPAFVTKKPFFFTIGQVRPKKNLHLLVDMMRHFPNHDLYICGDDHFKYAQKVREHIEALETRNAFLVGKITNEEKVWLYRRCEAFLFPSIGEGFGLPPIEAMQFGRAVFISNSTCLPEICGNCATIWSDLQPDAMASVVETRLKGFYDDTAYLEKLKSHAATFSYEKLFAAYMSLYKEMLFGKS